MPKPLPAHATILIQPVAPLDASHAVHLAREIRGQWAEHESPSDLRWTIKNKYYAADVGFRILKASGCDEDGEEPAIIVLAARTERPSETLSPLLKSLTSHSADFEVALLVSLPTDSSTSVRPDEEAWEDLAMDHGYEWVDLPPNEEDLGTVGDEAQDEGGLRRIVGALHAHMWEGMVPTSRNGSTQSTSEALDRAVDRGLTLDSDEEDISALAAPPLPSPRPYIPTPVAFPTTFLPSLKPTKSTVITSSPSSQRATTATAARISFEDDFAPFVPALPSEHTSFPPLSTIDGSAGSPPRSGALYRHPELAFPDTESRSQVPDSDEDDDDLDEMFAKLKGVREEAMGLDMEARRALAEKTVLGLFGGAVDDADED